MLGLRMLPARRDGECNMPFTRIATRDRRHAPSPGGTIEDLDASDGSRSDRRGAGAADKNAGPAPASMPREKIENLVTNLIAEFLELKDEAEAATTMDGVPRVEGSEVAANKVSESKRLSSLLLCSFFI